MSDERGFEVGDTVHVKENPVDRRGAPIEWSVHGDVFYAGKRVLITGFRAPDLTAVRGEQPGDPVRNALVHNLERCAEFEVGDRVRVSKAEEHGFVWSGKRGKIILVGAGSYDWVVAFGEGDAAGTAFNSCELEPLAEVWKVARRRGDGTLVSSNHGGQYAELTYVPGQEVEQCVAFTDYVTAKNYASGWGGFRPPLTVEVWRSECAGVEECPTELTGGSKNIVSCRHLMVLERVAVYRDGVGVKPGLPLEVLSAAARPEEAVTEPVGSKEERAMAKSEPCAELAAVRRSADEFQAVAEGLEGELAEAKADAERLEVRNVAKQTEANHFRGEASDLRGRLARNEERVVTMHSRLNDAEKHATLREARIASLVEARGADAGVVEAAVARVRAAWADTTDLNVLSRETAALVRAVQDHPAYKAAEAEPAPEPAKPKKCIYCASEIHDPGWKGVLCGKHTAMRDDLNALVKEHGE